MYYCSTSCQKKDWEKHRLVCKKKKQPTPLEAWKELCQLVASSTPAEANQGFYQARDEIIKIETEEKTQYDAKEKQSTSVVHTVPPLDSTTAEEENSEPSSPRYQGSLSYTIEKMPNLSMYQVIIHLKSAQSQFFDLRTCKTGIVSGNILSVQLSPFEPLLQINLPSTNKNMTIVGNPRLVDLVEQDHRALYLRLVDMDQNMDPISMDINHRLLLRPQDACKLACRTCEQKLIKVNTIQNAVLMPSSRWEDMADYLTCFDPTNTTVETLSSPTSGSGKPHHILQDTTTFVVHIDDVKETSLCVLAIPGYGQEDKMEDSTAQNTWMQNSIGATLTCSCCADILGEASTVDTFRLFHHKLSLVDEIQVTVVSTLGSFIANELIRHAEARAVYSFGVVNQAQLSRILQIQLVSWESEAAHSYESSVDAKGLHQLQWRKVAKVMFYETTHIMDEPSSPSLFWQTDWCCDPVTENSQTATPGTTNNIIKLYLPSSEWTSLKDELTELSQKQVREIAEATIMAKTGNSVSNEMQLATLIIN